MWTIEQLDELTIRHGQHARPNGKVEVCAMEASYLRWAVRQGWDKKRIVAGWTDSLDCVCPVIGGFVRRWNDGIAASADGNARRTALFTPDILDILPGTRGDDALMLRRMWMAIDWDIRVRTPQFLRLAKLESCAVALESLPAIGSQGALVNARAACEEARKQGAAAGDAAGDAAWAAAGAAAGAAAWAAAGDAAGDAVQDAAGDAAWAAVGAAAWAAAGDAAGDAVRDAAGAAAWDAAGDAAWAAARAAARAAAGDAVRDAAWDAVGAAAWAAAGAAAWDAAGAAAWDAVRDAAWAAVRDAAGDALRPTVEHVQGSALDLLRRMCADVSE